MRTATRRHRVGGQLCATALAFRAVCREPFSSSLGMRSPKSHAFAGDAQVQPHRGRYAPSALPPSPRSFAAASPPEGRALTENEGLFQNMHFNDYPVRAAIDIGTGGVVSLCVARVDAARSHVVKVLYQTQLPLFLEAQTPSSSPSASDGGAFLLSEATLTDIRNKMRVLHGAMRRDAYEGLSERAAVIAWPLCEATNAMQLAEELTREFKLDVRVLAHNFHVEWPFATTPPATGTGAAHDDVVQPGGSIARNTRTATIKAKSASLRQLVHEAKQRRRRTRAAAAADPPPPQPDDAHGAKSESVPAKEQVERLAFLAHAAMAQCVAAQRMLVITEDPQRGLSLRGADTSAAFDAGDLLREATTPEAVQSILTRARLTNVRSSAPADVAASALVSSASVGLVEHRLAVDAAAAHRLCVTRIQRRDEDTYGLHTSSPNPVLAKEFDALVNMLTPMIAETLPEWVRRKSALGGVMAGTSINGGVLNLAARVSQRAPIPLDHLEVHARHHFCGLTDVLLAANFPNPLLVLPSTALACALLRALETPRVTYLPELSTACALLTQPTLWTRDREAAIRATQSRQQFYQSVQHRTFHRPHRKDNPTAAPGATRDTHVGQAELSPENSYKEVSTCTSALLLSY